MLIKNSLKDYENRYTFPEAIQDAKKSDRKHYICFFKSLNQDVMTTVKDTSV